MADFLTSMLTKAAFTLLEALVARLVWQLWTSLARSYGMAVMAPAAA